ncbi:MAG: hypothetical protein CHKLHMKO_00259 [Candidatus Argoarchaeum ethanivorans]|uniref:Uncharacterized protein n=1 Tax=Candidatus Argoarchaeum ethanivorans TaxID=2608793 RepID=A0A811TC54_9EURY|nr:MAG: hypothetical protein CHKLHMKO_00259 [Candidatus Argoarchaeum ethanivorans]
MELLDKLFGKRGNSSSVTRDGIEFKIVDLRPDKEKLIEKEAQSSLGEKDEQIAHKLLFLISQVVSKYETDKEAYKKNKSRD